MQTAMPSPTKSGHAAVLNGQGRAKSWAEQLGGK